MRISKRFKNIIDREKKLYPDKSSLILLFNRIYKVSFLRFHNMKMNLKKDSTFQLEEDMYMCSLFPKKLLDIIIKDIKPMSILDIGCGTGQALAYFIENEINATGIENSALAISKSPVKEKIIQHNLKKELNLNKKFDLVWCFEVAEHIHPKYESVFMQSLMNHSDKIIISAAKPGQGGHGHFNEKEPEYWIEKFIKSGYHYNAELTSKMKNTGETHAENILFFEK